MGSLGKGSGSTNKARAAGTRRREGRPGDAPAFMKRGRAAAAERERAEKRRQARRSGTFRFWMKPGDEKVITFLDGGLGEDGLLACPSYYEHTVPHGGRFADVYCPARNEDADGRTGRCPICDAGGDRSDPSFVSAFTVIEWGGWEDKKGNAHDYRRRLFVAKHNTQDLLLAKALKLAKRKGTDGLVGVTFEVTRANDKAPRVGDAFEAIGITPPAKLKKGMVLVDGDEDDWGELEEASHAQPLDYTQEFRQLTAEEMEDLGFGAPPDKQFGRQRRGGARRGADAGSGKGSRRRSIEDDL